LPDSISSAESASSDALESEVSDVEEVIEIPIPPVTISAEVAAYEEVISDNSYISASDISKSFNENSSLHASPLAINARTNQIMINSQNKRKTTSNQKQNKRQSKII